MIALYPYHHLYHNPWSSSLTTSSIPSNCYLSDIVVFDADEHGHLTSDGMMGTLPVVESAFETGTAKVTTNQLPNDAAAGMAIPVHRGGSVVSIVLLLAKKPEDSSQDPVGVFEVWEPIGEYEEVSLRQGYYGKMERFQNVSSFVRFEKGNGLPGQVWERSCAVIHDDLANHPGFLRAAGASADLLRTAIGIPIAGKKFESTAVLISSATTPIARGMEVWSVCPDTDEFELTSAAYHELGEGYELPVGTKCSKDSAPFARMKDEIHALVTDDPNELLAQRSPDVALPGPTSGLAIPFFEGVTLTSLTVLLF